MNWEKRQSIDARKFQNWAWKGKKRGQKNANPAQRPNESDSKVENYGNYPK